MKMQIRGEQYRLLPNGSRAPVAAPAPINNPFAALAALRKAA